jgi:2-aminoethylphosphonate-pyruvate transaminase
MQQVVEAANQSLNEMGVSSAAPPAEALKERAKLAA